MPTAAKARPQAARQDPASGARPAKPLRPRARQGLGALPEWNLADLYPAIDAPEVKRDLDRADAECVAFEEAYKGKLAALAAGADAGAKLAEAVQALRGARRSARPAHLVCGPRLCRQHDRSGARQVLRRHAGEDHARPRCICCSSRSSSIASTTPRWRPRWRDPALGHYRPWLEDIRKEKPYQLEDRIEELFHEKSVTGAGAWNRLFDETIGALRFKVDGKELAIEQTLSLMQDADGSEAPRRVRGARARPSRRTCASSR